MFWRRRQFRELVERQLRLFADEHGELVTRARAALVAYDAEPDAQESVHRYAEYDDLAEDVELALYEMCESFSTTLEPPLDQKYIQEFDRQAKRAYRDLVPRLDVFQPRDDLDA